MTRISAERTLGHSPKVVWPGLALALLGGALILVGELLDSRKLRDIGMSNLGSSVLGTALGYAAPPGAIVAPDHDVVEIHEHDETARPQPGARSAS